MKSELYRPQESVYVDSKIHEEIQGEGVPSTHIPFRDEAVRFFSQVSISPTQYDSFSHQDNDLIQVSPSHGRSYELNLGHNVQLFFSDEYGNVYSSVTTKGNNLQAARVQKTTETESGFCTWGMHESDSMVRILRASNVMRKAGIDTELILKVLEPTQFPFGQAMVTASEFKKRIVQDVWSKDSSIWDSAQAEKDDIPNLSRYFENSTFFITVRGLQVAERLTDLEHCSTRKDFLTMMEKVFNYVNKLHELDGNTQRFDPTKVQDTKNYFADYLPKKVATNLARLHCQGLTHGCPISHNINLAGGLIDLDSVTGPQLGLGDKEHTSQQLLDEVEQTRSTISNPELIKKLSKFFAVKKEDNLQEVARNFTRQYLDVSASLIEEASGLDLSKSDSPETILRALDEANDWNIERIIKLASEDEGGPLRRQVRAFAASSNGIFKDPFLERINNRPLSEFVRQGFLEFQTARSRVYLEDVYGYQIQELESRLGKDAADALCAVYSAHRVLNQEVVMTHEWETVEKQLLEKWFRESAFAKKYPEIGGMGAKVLQSTSAETKGLIKSGEVLLCGNKTRVEDFITIVNSLNGARTPIHAFTAPNEGIFAFMSTREDERPVIIFTDGDFGDTL